jgi:nucleoside-diphosphate-sugar epimerase
MLTGPVAGGGPVDIVGDGFIARNLATIADRHPHATVLAAGVSSTGVREAAAFARETELVRDATTRCRRAGRMLVFLSSASHSMYGNTDVAADETTVVRPESPYGRQKLALERMVAESGVRWLALRLSHVTGRWQRPHQILPSLVSQVRSGTVTVYRGAHRDLVDVVDVVRAIDGLLEHGVQDEIVNVASGTAVPVERIVRGVEQRLGVSARHEIVDRPPVLTTVSIAKLGTLLPALRSVGDSRYPDRILDRYVAYY